jgi:hypothetical protein
VVTMIPPGAKPGTNRSEREVFTAFEGIPDRPDWIVIHSLQLAQNLFSLEGEADFIVMVPGKGIVVIEAKNPKYVEYTAGQWYLDKLPNPTKDPLQQVSRARSNIRGYLKQHDENINDIPFARMLWFTSIGRHQFINNSAGDMQFFEWELGLAEDKDKPVLAIEKLLDNHIAFFADNGEVHYDPSAFTSERAENLANTLLSNFTGYESAEELAKTRYKIEQKMLDEQLAIMELVEYNNHLYFDGGAGTGKSFLLAEAARKFAKQGKRTLVTCWNYMMAEELASTLTRPGITVKDLNTIMLEICGLKENPADAGTQWFEHDLPIMALEALEKNPALGSYEALCVDEFQDVAANLKLLEVLFELVKTAKLENIPMVFAGDRNQQIMRDGVHVIDPAQRMKLIMPDTVHIRLRTNCRTVPELAKMIPRVINIDTDIVRHRIPEGFEGGLSIVDCSDEKQTQHLATTIKKLLERYPARDIVILSAFGDHNSTVGQLLQRGSQNADERALVSQLKTAEGDGKIRWRSIAKFKGLESPVVVITDVDEKAKEFAHSIQKELDELLYVGITRAKYECVLIGDAVPANKGYLGSEV